MKLRKKPDLHCMGNVRCCGNLSSALPSKVLREHTRKDQTNRKGSKPLIGTSNSCKLLIDEEDCSLTADYYLQFPYRSYYWNQIGLTIKYTGSK